MPHEMTRAPDGPTAIRILCVFNHYLQLFFSSESGLIELVKSPFDLICLHLHMSVSDYLTDAISHLLCSSFWQTDEFKLNANCKVQNVDDGMQIDLKETWNYYTRDINHYLKTRECHKETHSIERRWHRNRHKTTTDELTATKTNRREMQNKATTSFVVICVQSCQIVLLLCRGLVQICMPIVS